MIGLLKENLVLIGTVVFFVLMCVRGYRRGFVRMIASFAGVAVSLFLARLFMPKLVARMEQNNAWMTWVKTKVVPKLVGITASMVFSVLGFMVIFIVSLVLIKILVSTLEQLARRSFFGIINEVFGIAVGAAEALIYIWVFMLLVEVLPHFPLCEEILRQINADGLLSILHENNLLVTFLSGISLFGKI